VCDIKVPSRIELQAEWRGWIWRLWVWGDFTSANRTNRTEKYHRNQPPQWRDVQRRDASRCHWRSFTFYGGTVPCGQCYGQHAVSGHSTECASSRHGPGQYALAMFLFSALPLLPRYQPTFGASRYVKQLPDLIRFSSFLPASYLRKPPINLWNLELPGITDLFHLVIGTFQTP